MPSCLRVVQEQVNPDDTFNDTSLDLSYRYDATDDDEDDDDDDETMMIMTTKPSPSQDEEDDKLRAHQYGRPPC